MDLDKKQLRKVTDLLLLFEKAVRSRRIYPSGHPSASAFKGDSYRRFKIILAWLHPLRLTVDRYDLLLEGHTVYSNQDREESLAFILYRDGIREIIFHLGLTEEELGLLAEAFVREIDSEHLDEDLATYLWENDMENITIHVIDDYFDDFLPEDLKDADDFLGAIRDQVASEPFSAEALKEGILTEPLSSVKVTSIPLKKPFLDPEKLRMQSREIQHIRNLMAREEEELYFEDVLEIIISMLLSEKSAEQVEVYLTLFQNMLQLLFVSGPVSQAVLLLRKIRRLADGYGSLPYTITEKLEDFLVEVGSPDTIATLGESIQLGRLEDTEFLPDLIAFFPPSAVFPLTALFESVDSMKLRKAICHGLSIIGRRDIDELVRALRSRKWFVVRNVAYTLGLTKSPAAVKHLGALIKHEDVRVRKEALRALGRIGGIDASQWISSGLLHADAETRRQALSSLPRTPNRALADMILQISRSEDFEGRSLEEREGFCRLLGHLSDDALIEVLEEDFLSRRWFASTRRHERQFLACTALAALDSAAARERLSRSLPTADDKTAALIRSSLAKKPSNAADARERRK